MCILRWITPHRVLMLPSRVIVYSIAITSKQTNNSVPGKEHLLLSCWSTVSKRLSEQFKLLPFPLVASQNLKVRPYCWGYHMLQSQDLEISRWYWLRASSLRASFHSVESMMQVANGESYLIILLNCKTCKPQQWPDWQDFPRGVIMALIFWG